MSQIGKTIKLLRVNAGIKQKDLAERLSISANYLSLLEHDKREPSISLIERLAKELDVSIGYIFLNAYEKPKNLPRDQEHFFDLIKDLLSYLQKPNAQNKQ